MIRGAQKKMIVVRTHDSRVFEEAYFVVRPDRDPPPEENDMLSEATRIIHRNTAGVSLPPRYPRPSRIKARILGLIWFLCGMLFGGGGVILWYWLG
ncbi:MAG: hypothetical protein J6D87_06900 [Clostridia bacterium]|nr:hypothetical protein [Clostridia bacterium]MBQ7315898.1 hypothetical protein [Clostridia bacterium]